MDDMERHLNIRMLEKNLQEKEERLYNLASKHQQHKDIVDECESLGAEIENDISMLYRVLEALKNES